MRSEDGCSLYYRQAIAIQPDLVDAHYNLGVALQQRYGVVRGDRLRSKSLGSQSQHSKAYISLGHIIGGTIMDREQVVVKRIVSPDGKNIAEVKSFAKASGDGQTEISQSFSVKVSCDQNSSSSSQSGYSSISCTDGNNSNSSS